MDPNSQLSFLNCYICFEGLKKPKMCPSCSKVACQKCLRSWVEQRRPQCPHCRKTMALNNFAECQRFISDIKHLVKAIDQNQRVKQKCPQHKIQMTYYCQDCQVPICSDCGMFGSKHKEHKLTHLKKIYQQYKNKILNELTNFDQRIEGYRQNGYHIKVEMQKLVMQIGQRKSFIEKYFIAIIERLQQQFQQKQQKISEKYDKNSKQIEFLQSFRDNIYSQLQKSSQNQLITKCDELIGYVQSVYDKGPELEHQQYSFDTMQKIYHIFSHEIVPKYNQFTYKLQNYPSLGKGIVYSDPYVHNGIEWKLKIYPQGNGQAQQTHLSVFLEMSKGYVNGNKYEYKLELLNRKSVKDSVIREYSSNFDIGECWGYNQFIPIQQLKEQFLSDEGDLLFKVSVRNPSYRSLVRDQHQYITSLQEKVAAHSNREKQQNSINNIIGSKKSIKNYSAVHLGGNPKIYEQKTRADRQIFRKYLESNKDQQSQQLENEEQQRIPKLNKINSSSGQKNTKNHFSAGNVSSLKHQRAKSKKVIQEKEEDINYIMQKKQEAKNDSFDLDSFLEISDINKKKQQKKIKINIQQRRKNLKQKQKEKQEKKGSLSMFDGDQGLLLDSRQQFQRDQSSQSVSRSGVRQSDRDYL